MIAAFLREVFVEVIIIHVEHQDVVVKVGVLGVVGHLVVAIVYLIRKHVGRELIMKRVNYEENFIYYFNYI